MKNIWIPHIPKTGGSSLKHSIEEYCIKNSDRYIYNKFENKPRLKAADPPRFFFRQVIDKKTGCCMNLDRNNPLKHNMEDMKNVWIPHIPKTGGTSLMASIEEYCTENPDRFIFNKLGEARKGNERRQQVIDKKTNGCMNLDHNNPLKHNMEDWLKILIVRDPISRFVSYFNFQKYSAFKNKNKLDTRTFDEFLHWQQPDGSKERQNALFKSIIDYLNLHQPEDFLFSLDNIKTKVDYIFDISEIDKAYSIIEEQFLQTKIKWTRHNTTEDNFKFLNSSQNEYKFQVFKKEDITSDQMKILLKHNMIIEDLKFYEKYMDTSYS